LINELAGVEEVINEQTLADQEAATAAEQAALNEEAAAELAGEVTPTVERREQAPRGTPTGT
jgi:hypothetical protein